MEQNFLLASGDYLDTRRAADYLGVGESTMRSWRAHGTFGGPAYFSFNKRIYYAIADLDSWAGVRLRRHASNDNGRSVVVAPGVVKEITTCSQKDLDSAIGQLEEDRALLDERITELTKHRDALHVHGGAQ